MTNGRYFVGYNRKVHKYVLLDPNFKIVANFEWAKDLFDYCDDRGYEYVIF